MMFSQVLWQLKDRFPMLKITPLANYLITETRQLTGEKDAAKERGWQSPRVWPPLFATVIRVHDPAYMQAYFQLCGVIGFSIKTQAFKVPNPFRMHIVPWRNFPNSHQSRPLFLPNNDRFGMH